MVKIVNIINKLCYEHVIFLILLFIRLLFFYRRVVIADVHWNIRSLLVLKLENVQAPGVEQRCVVMCSVTITFFSEACSPLFLCFCSKLCSPSLCIFSFLLVSMLCYFSFIYCISYIIIFLVH